MVTGVWCILQQAALLRDTSELKGKVGPLSRQMNYSSHTITGFYIMWVQKSFRLIIAALTDAVSIMYIIDEMIKPCISKNWNVQ